MRHNRGLFRRISRRRMHGSQFLVLAMIMAVLIAVYFIRRNNLMKAGIQPKPLMEDVRDVYGRLQDRLDRGDYSGILGEILGRQ
ncbi:hypothetical protein [Methanooceanicella nereidis]|uniref:hypothetical protein n=1 Tax=Methanooceanicella nereidis TaxID=2052831 RepID=UPI001E39C27C|nr:hypothetical protein [Methanocella sp. CWC-04]